MRPDAWWGVRVRVARLTRAMRRWSRARREAPFAELQRIESDPAYRALFFAELAAAISDREAEREAVVHAIEVAADRLRRLAGAGERGRAAGEQGWAGGVGDGEARGVGGGGGRAG